MGTDYSAKRRYARLTFKEPVTGDVTSSHDVHILDLSLGGARVEHTIILRPGSSCYLRLPLKEQVVTVMGRVVWSQAVGRAAANPSGTGLVYQSGVEFGALAQEAHSLLVAFLESRAGTSTEGGPS
ncbi:MAG: PilZ domain-containing protein [candidate division NC10 bacterium]|nr:PilZ domain-containing protein [candidate division NC10 bacterium]MBI2162785.1 PilZ domain-containing protein [candidate division NC10 bacterium]MBI2562239.1 PilZ domain-containing protein [candidate division NC10 bacterium]MBI3084169.1 PilZ domain-containing protein [candidate division NC10 bacterium]